MKILCSCSWNNWARWEAAALSCEVHPALPQASSAAPQRQLGCSPDGAGAFINKSGLTKCVTEAGMLQTQPGKPFPSEILSRILPLAQGTGMFSHCKANVKKEKFNLETSAYAIPQNFNKTLHLCSTVQLWWLKRPPGQDLVAKLKFKVLPHVLSSTLSAEPVKMASGGRLWKLMGLCSCSRSGQSMSFENIIEQPKFSNNKFWPA